MLDYSYTINISPFKKQPNGIQFAKLTWEEQEAYLLVVLSQIKEILGGDWSDYVFEKTNRNYPHLHGLVKLDSPITSTQQKVIDNLSNKYGNNYYNKAIYIEYCHSGTAHWKNYMRKDQEERPSSPGIPLSVFLRYNQKKGENKNDSE
jgi:hypothetical protein